MGLGQGVDGNPAAGGADKEERQPLGGGDQRIGRHMEALGGIGRAYAEAAAGFDAKDFLAVFPEIVYEVDIHAPVDQVLAAARIA